jgi:hypothetical protein
VWYECLRSAFIDAELVSLCFGRWLIDPSTADLGLPWNSERLTTPEMRLSLVAAFSPVRSEVLCRNRTLRHGSMPSLVLRPNGTVVAPGPAPIDGGAAPLSQPAVLRLVPGDDTADACTNDVAMDVMEGTSRDRSCSTLSSYSTVPSVLYLCCSSSPIAAPHAGVSSREASVVMCTGLVKHVMRVTVDDRMAIEDDVLRSVAATWMHRVAVAARDSTSTTTVAQLFADVGLLSDSTLDQPVRDADVWFSMPLRPPLFASPEVACRSLQDPLGHPFNSDSTVRAQVAIPRYRCPALLRQ